MKTDSYTKTVLTIIAFCLTFNVISQLDLIPSAYAAEPISTNNEAETIDVRIIGIRTSDVLDVNINEIGGGWVNYGGPIPVEIKD